MKYKETPKNPRTAQLFAYCQIHNKEILRLGELQEAFEISARQEKELLAYMSNKGSITRLKRGVYLVPQILPPSGKWQPDPKYLVSCLMEEIGANYYIGGPFAFHYHGLTEQIPNSITVYNDKISGRKILGNLNAMFIKVATNRLGSTEKINMARGHVANIATLARCIVDAVNDYNRYNTIPKAYWWIKKYSQDFSILKEIVRETHKFANISTKRRIGFIIHTLLSDDKLVKILLDSLQETQSWIPLVPYSSAKGKTDKQWRIINNVRQSI